MKTFIKDILKKFNFKSKDNRILLGRWGHKNTYLKADYSNHDHCGDKICKDPINYKKCIYNDKV